LDRYSRFALSNSQNVAKFVAIVSAPPIDANRATRQILTEEQFKDFISSDALLKVLAHKDGFVQAYLRPAKGFDCTYCCQVSIDQGKLLTFTQQANKSEDTTAPERFIHSFSVCREEAKQTDLSTSLPTSALVEKQIAEATAEIVRFLQLSHNKIVVKAVVRYIVDDNEHAWLSEIANCSVCSASELETLFEVKEIDAKDKRRNSKEEEEKEERVNEKAKEAGGHKAQNNDKKRVDAPKEKEKKKKGGEGKGGPTKKTSKLDEPPNIELLAKFAAERDR
jgi:hypothetical protein